jgi:hypothetical protein
MLRAEFENGSLQKFYRQAARLMGSKEPVWRAIWEAGPIKTILRTRTFLDELNLGSSDYLNDGRVFEVPVDPDDESRRLGMCGTLRPYLPEGALIAGPSERHND